MVKKAKKTKVTRWKPTSRTILKDSKQATIVYKGSGNKHFKEEYEQQGAFLSWR